MELLFSSAELGALYQPEAAIYLAAVLGLLSLGVWSFGLTMRVKLAAELAHTDNKALAVSLAGYTLGLAAILHGVLTTDGLASLSHDLVDLVLSGLAGIGLLHLGRVALDRLALRPFSTRDQVLRGNLAVGCAEAGNALGTGLIVMRALAISGLDETERLIEAAVFFTAAQAAFIVFAIAYRRVLKFDALEHLEAGNAAVGIALGATLGSQGLLLSYAISQTASLVVFFAWFLLSTTLLLVLRKALDLILLRGHNLDHELSVDKNWGVALVEGAVALSVALILTGAF